MQQPIRVGITEWHGAVHEAAQLPPVGVTYGGVEPAARGPLWPIRSPIKGYLRRIDNSGFDIIEAIISPIHTEQRWIYSLAHYAEALAFSVWNMPLPKWARREYISRLLVRPNCKKIIFWSSAGLRTLAEYGGTVNEDLIKKTRVVYPAVRKIDSRLPKRYEANRTHINILFNGDFFRKGGAHVIDAFERIQQETRAVKLRLCCDEKLDFNTSDDELRNRYLHRIKANEGITLGRVSRKEMMENVFPDTDVYVLPTYADAFGFAILEAMAYGIPVISTNQFAIPEMVSDGENGLLIDIGQFPCAKMFPGYFVRSIPRAFHDYMSSETYNRMRYLIDSREVRQRMGWAGLEAASTRFSISSRNGVMKQIYEEALSP